MHNDLSCGSMGAPILVPILPRRLSADAPGKVEEHDSTAWAATTQTGNLEAVPGSALTIGSIIMMYSDITTKVGFHSQIFGMPSRVDFQYFHVKLHISFTFLK